jgi:hypothetical protein
VITRNILILFKNEYFDFYVLKIKMTLQSIIDKFSDTAYTDAELEQLYNEEDQVEIKLVYSIYGAIPVTPKVLDEINGQLVYGLIGQGLIDSDPKHRPRFAQQFTITKINGSNDRARVEYKNDNFTFEIYLFNGIYCSGSGADPVYVFIP